MALPKCQTCWGTIQPDEERRITRSHGLPLIYHRDTEICELLSEDWRQQQEDDRIINTAA